MMSRPTCILAWLLLVVIVLATNPVNSSPKTSEDADSQQGDGNQEIDVPAKLVAELRTDRDKRLQGLDSIDKESIIKKDPYGRLLDSRLDVGFIHAFVASLSVIIVSELGDKTFFIAAIMAMRHSRMVVFAGAIAALGTMTVLSAIVGYATTVIPRWLTYYVSSGLFFLFGIKMLREGYGMSADEGKEEYEEAQNEIKKKEETMESDAESGTSRIPQRRILYSIFSRVFIESFTLTFLAEWGDRSQIATIILAAREEVIGVILGGTIGHALCTGLAVLGGRFIAQKISIKTVTLIGGIVFIIFALSAFFISPDEV